MSIIKMIPATIISVTIVLVSWFTMCHAYPTKQDWPEECKGRSYCHVKPDYYPAEKFAELLKGMKFSYEQNGGISNRSSETDVADCRRGKMYEKFYLLLDENESIRFVAQNDDAFSIMIEIEECRTPGRTYSSALHEEKLQEHRVDCYETKIPFMFPVLSLDGTKLESAAPKDGLPMSCSAKVIET